MVLYQVMEAWHSKSYKWGREIMTDLVEKANAHFQSVFTSKDNSSIPITYI